MNGLRYLCSCGGIAVGVFGLMVFSPVHAQDMPCTEEIRTFCADVQPGGGRILQCLKTNEAKLPPACVRRIDDLRAAFSGPVGAACRDDWAALCYHPKASTDRQAMLQCLQANQAQVSTGCQKALREGTGPRRERAGERMP